MIVESSKRNRQIIVASSNRNRQVIAKSSSSNTNRAVLGAAQVSLVVKRLSS